jgi:threonine aldolase
MPEPCRDFSSDNITPAAPELIAALMEANQGTAHSYGDDPWTRRLEARAQAVFGCELAIYPVATGTASNALALAAMSPPHGGVFCHEDAHIDNDECAAPGFFTGGAQLLGLPGAHGKLEPAVISPVLARMRERGVHQVRPAAISLSQATEWGTVYTPGEIAAITGFAHAQGMTVHMDGARLANAIAALGCTPAEATVGAGVDVLSLGATKNGALAAEAVIFFNLELAAEFEYRRKRAAQLFSKMRYASAQLAAFLEDGLWLRLATQANAMAARLAAGLAQIQGISLAAPVQANELFVVLPEPVLAALQAEGFGFYRWNAPAGVTGSVIRLVTAWCTQAEDVDTLLEACHRHARG